MKREGLKVIDIVIGSIASQKGIASGDFILSINHHPVSDIIDYRFYSSEEYLRLEIKKPDGKRKRIDIEKEYSEDIGIIPEDIKPKRCSNKCIFCFVHQMPKGLRRTLYVTDEDYRLSFLHGNGWQSQSGSMNSRTWSSLWKRSL